MASGELTLNDSFSDHIYTRIHDPQTGKSYFSKKRRRCEDDLSPRSITFTCYHRYKFLLKDRSRIWLVDAIEEGRHQYPVDLWSWVIMPEHVHLLLRPRESGKDAGDFLKFVKEKVGRKAITWMAENSSEWIPG